MDRRILIIAGPTAVGKTEYAIEVANAIGGEIVSADSMQLYKYMDIGSAKPTPEERAAAVHHLVDEIDPREEFSAYKYQQRAKAAIEDIFSRGKVPVISGGTGLYVNALIYDMDFSAKPEDRSRRKEYEEYARVNGNEALHKILEELDPAAAERIHCNNVQKVVRAIEMLKSGQKNVREFSEAFVKTSDYDYCLIGLKRERAELCDRINMRVDILMEMGLLDEIKRLGEMGLTEDFISMKGIGYKELFGYLNGEYDLEEAVRRIKANTRRYSKRQMTWFKRYEDIKWFDLTEYGSKQDAVRDMIEYWNSFASGQAQKQD